MSNITVTFPRLNQFWNDSGVLGLYRCIIGDIHQEPQRGVDNPRTHLDAKFQTSTKLEADQLVISGEADAVQGLLETAYNDCLIKHYYDLSSQKQWEEMTSHNFFLNAEGVFESFPKRKARGIAAFIYDKAPRPAGEQVKWADKTPGKLPDDYADLQDRLDEFLKLKELKPGPPAGMLVDEPNRVRPKVIIQVQEPNRKSTRKISPCFLCGGTSSKMEKMNQTIFPFMTGESGVLSFFSTTRGAPRVCWRCSFIGKFVPVNGFYIETGGHLHMFFPFAPNLCKMNDVYNRLIGITEWEPNFYRNIDQQLGGYFTHPSEMAFAFLHRVYAELTTDDELNEEDPFEDEEVFQEEMFDFALKNAPLSFFIVSTEQKGQIQMPTQVRLYDDLAYLFRLFRHLRKKGMGWKSVAQNMLDFTAVKDDNKSLKRNRMLDAVLTKQSILKQAETFAFHVNRSENRYIAPLVEFTTQYETLLKGDHKMEKEALDAAVALGRRIGAAVAKESGKKGNLFSLRKCRKLSDFLNELNRLQFRFNVVIPPAVYEGYLTDANFEEFKGFCLLAGLNAFNAGIVPKRETTTQSN